MKCRNTLQRSLIIEAARTMSHPTADEVYNSLVARYPTISRGTVYRNLSLLVQQGQLRKVLVPGGADHYDITLEDHYHIRCKACGAVCDVDLPYQTGLINSILNTRGFLIEDHDIVMGGVCAGCRRDVGFAL